MNKERRKELKKAIELVEEAKSIIDNVQGDEQESFDNLSEGLQATERGEQLQTNVETMDEAMSSLDECVNSLEELM